MKADAAPLYVRTHDLVLWLLQRTTRFPRNQRFVLGRRVEESGLDLLETVTLALVSRRLRDVRLDEADEALVRVRVAVRMCREMELLRARQAAHACRQLDEIGRMIGGWKRSRPLSHADP